MKSCSLFSPRSRRDVQVACWQGIFSQSDSNSNLEKSENRETVLTADLAKILSAYQMTSHFIRI